MNAWERRITNLTLRHQTEVNPLRLLLDISVADYLREKPRASTVAKQDAHLGAVGGE